MPQVTLETINLGGYANDGTGDDLRTAFAKVIANFQTIKNAIPTSLAEDPNPTLGGDLNLNGKNLYSNNDVTLTIPEGKKFKVTGPVEAPRFIGKISDISDHKLDELLDVVIPESVLAGDSLVFDGDVWKPGTISATFGTVDGGSSAALYIIEEDFNIDGGNA